MAFEYSGEISTTDPICVKMGENACHHFGKSKIYLDLGPKQRPQQSLLVTPLLFLHFTVNVDKTA